MDEFAAGKIKRPLGTVPQRDPGSMSELIAEHGKLVERMFDGTGLDASGHARLAHVRRMIDAAEAEAGVGPEPCSCEESVALRASVERLRSIAASAITLLAWHNKSDAAALRAHLDGVP